ncbi:MAG: hypothetical protein R3D03_07825 [Geminicoccaceae bacterium]
MPVPAGEVPRNEGLDDLEGHLPSVRFVHLVLDSRGREDNQKAFEGSSASSARAISTGSCPTCPARPQPRCRRRRLARAVPEYRFDPDDIVVSADREFVNPNSVTIFRNLEKFLKKIGAETSFST